MTSLLPVEISDAVIDQLWHDHRTLRPTSLVSRAWRARSQYHLFHTLKCSSDAHIDRLASAPHLAAHIQHFELLTTLKYCAALPSLPGVHTLTLSHTLPHVSYYVPYTHVAACTPDLTRVFPAVRDLTIKRMRFESSATLDLIICALPSTIHLHLDFIGIIEEEGPGQVDIDSPGDAAHPALVSLSFDQCYDPPIYTFWCRPMSLHYTRRLCRLAFRPDPDTESPAGDSAAIGTLAAHAALTLEELALEADKIDILQEIAYTYSKNAHMNSALRELTLSLQWPEYIEPASALSALVHSMDPALQVHVTLRIATDKYVWDTLAAQLVPSKFPWTCTVDVPVSVFRTEGHALLSALGIVVRVTDNHTPYPYHDCDNWE